MRYKISCFFMLGQKKQDDLPGCGNPAALISRIQSSLFLSLIHIYDGAGLLRLCGLCVCLLRFGCVHIGFVLFAALRLQMCIRDRFHHLAA